MSDGKTEKQLSFPKVKNLSGALQKPNSRPKISWCFYPIASSVSVEGK